MDALQMLLRDHARAHSNAVGQPEGGISIADFVVSGLDDDQIRRSPQAGMNSLAWLIWHMARAEDSGVNLLVAPQRCWSIARRSGGARARWSAPFCIRSMLGLRLPV
jgi:hypothetical protein